MLAESNLPIEDEYDIESEFSTDLLIRQEIEQMRNDIDKIKDRLECFESSITQLTKDKDTPQPPSTNAASILIGPIAKSLKSQIEEIQNHTDQELENTDNEKLSIAAEEINQFFDGYNSPDVDNLKKQLEEKLRKAEVEMSIQRARVFQQKAELEEMKLQLEQREAAIRKTVENNDDPTKRWDRHFQFLRKK